jgi:hypothetical protein
MTKRFILTSIAPTLVLALALGAIGAPAMAQQPNATLQALDDALPGTLINDPTKMNWTLYGQGGQSRQVRARGAPGDLAYQVQSPVAGATLYELGFNVPITTNVRVGEQITVAFWARTVRAATPDRQGIVGLRVQRNRAPYPGFGDTRLAIGSAWKLYEVKFVADQAISSDLAVVGFQMSGARQTVEIGQTYVLDMGGR